ncbi:MAG: YvrJ family protein [Peptococcaceae bacterium]|nr:YvrJ family protein [Peptococcaceae bacterium]
MAAQDVPTWVNIMANFGFPILVALYLLMRFENKIDNLERTIHKLIDVIKEIRVN